ncbi:MAG: phosphatase PAP2 family protein [Xanthobacteraceae bacterium]|nr:phosphatase PAP2 family protein [Xanthobacteraceae bacterium]
MSAPPMAERAPSRFRFVCTNVVVGLARLVRRPRGGANPIWRAYTRVAVGAALAIAALILTMVFVDAAAIRAARHAPRWLVDAFQFVTDFGLAGWFLIPLGTALVAITLINSPALARMSQGVLATLAVRLGFLFLAIGVTGLVVTVIKRVVGRARPVIAGEDVFLYKFFLWRVEYASFPSGHATNAFAAAVAFGVLWPRLRPLLWTYAVIIALSRVIVTAHHPSDVVAGAIAGVIGALLVRDFMAARRLGFTVLPDGSVKPFPGPSWARIKKVARGLAGQ